MISLPPHCTHALQPLDRTVFGPLKSAYNGECSDFLVDHPLHVINKWTFPTLFRKSWEKALSVENITSGFRACGIYPFNAGAVPQSAYGPSKTTDVPLIQTTVAEFGDAMLATTPVTTDTPLIVAVTPVTADAPLHATPVTADTPLHATPVTADAQLHATPVTADAQLHATPVTTEHVFNTTFVQDDIMPVIDISDPAQLLQLITDGEFLVDDLPTCSEVVPTPLPEIIPEKPETFESCATSLFLPPQLTSREAPKRKQQTTHKILTSNEILGEKREKEKVKMEKEAKKVKKMKTKNK